MAGMIFVGIFIAVIALSPVLGRDSRTDVRAWWPGRSRRAN
jgi:hypothetical protein